MVRQNPRDQAGTAAVLTKRGADILVRVEKLLDEAGKTAARRPPMIRRADQTDIVKRAGLPGQLRRGRRRPGSVGAAEELVR